MSAGQTTAIDLNTGLAKIHGKSRDVELSVDELTPSRPVTLAAFAPFSPSLFGIRAIYGGFNFVVVGQETVDGHSGAVLDGKLAGGSGVGRVQLVIDADRGVLLAERSFASSGQLVREVTYRGYADFGGVLFPASAEEHIVSKRRQHRVVQRAEGISVHALQVNGSNAGGAQ